MYAGHWVGENSDFIGRFLRRRNGQEEAWDVEFCDFDHESWGSCENM
jgi:hypothetical protein